MMCLSKRDLLSSQPTEQLRSHRRSLLLDRIATAFVFCLQIDWANAHPAEAEAIGRAGLRFVEQDLSMRRVYEYMLHKFQLYAQLQVNTPCQHPM